MALPTNPQNASVGSLLGTNSSPGGFTTSLSPVANGLAVVNQPSPRVGYSTRNLMSFYLPSTSSTVSMYINPEKMTISEKKSINNVKTRGGWIVQMFGSEITELNIVGTTGSSSIEGINILYSVYRSEQISVDPYALMLNAQNATASAGSVGAQIGSLLTGSTAIPGASSSQSLFGGLVSGITNGLGISSTPIPSLASLATQIEIYYNGAVFHGYFTSFQITEGLVGLFDYTMTFMATQTRGLRSNTQPWHRSPNSGPSNISPDTGNTYSYGQLAGGGAVTQGSQITQSNNILASITSGFGI